MRQSTESRGLPTLPPTSPHEHTGYARSFGLDVMLHPSGAVAKLIPDVIACGIDVFDPVQVSMAVAPQMVAERFGD